MRDMERDGKCERHGALDTPLQFGREDVHRMACRQWTGAMSASGKCGGRRGTVAHCSTQLALQVSAFSEANYAYEFNNNPQASQTWMIVILTIL